MISDTVKKQEDAVHFKEVPPLSCNDDRRLLPDCRACIPGLALDKEGNCTVMTPDTAALRDTILGITKERYGLRNQVDFHLYPYLSVAPLTRRQQDVGDMIAQDQPQTILDIGPYTNPIWNYLPDSVLTQHSYCPELIVAVEPCGEVTTNTTKAWQSVFKPCPNQKGSFVHLLVIPMTAQEYFASQHFRETNYDAVVCIGCDGHFRPHTAHLAAVKRPFFLYLEYPVEYQPSRDSFQKSSIQENVCGTHNEPIRTTEYKFDPKKEPHLAPHVYSHHRLLSAYNCTQMVAKALPNNYSIECNPDEQSYAGMACHAEMHSILTVREEAYFPVDKEDEKAKLLIDNLPRRQHNCTLCNHVLQAYHLNQEGYGQVGGAQGAQNDWRTPFSITAAPAMANVSAWLDSHSDQSPPTLSMELVDELMEPTFVEWKSTLFCLMLLSLLGCVYHQIGKEKKSKSSTKMNFTKRAPRYLVAFLFTSVVSLATTSLSFRTLHYNYVPSILYQPSFHTTSDDKLRVDDAVLLLDHARHVSQKGASWDALAAATLARRLLHAGQPESKMITPGAPLYRAIVDYNQYLSNIVDTTSPPTYPATYHHALSQCPPHADTTFADISKHKLEPILPDTRNYGLHELDIIIDMFPYRVLPTFTDAFSRQAYSRRILIDVGSNGFYGSAKNLLDMYAPFAKFDDVHLFEPDSHGMEIPDYYRKEYNITSHQTFVQVGTRDSSDIITFLRDNTSKDDFVVLKFDVDEVPNDNNAMTMEWGFLADLMTVPELALVDELFIELHFFYPKLGWGWSTTHSMQQAYDVTRQLRNCGIAIHAWT